MWKHYILDPWYAQGADSNCGYLSKLPGIYSSWCHNWSIYPTWTKGTLQTFAPISHKNPWHVTVYLCSLYFSCKRIILCVLSSILSALQPSSLHCSRMWGLRQNSASNIHWKVSLCALWDECVCVCVFGVDVSCTVSRLWSPHFTAPRRPVNPSFPPQSIQ